MNRIRFALFFIRILVTKMILIFRQDFGEDRRGSIRTLRKEAKKGTLNKVFHVEIPLP